MFCVLRVIEILILDTVVIHDWPGVLKQTDVMCNTRTCRLREKHWNIMACTRLFSLTGPTYRSYYSEVHYSSVKSQKDGLSERLNNSSVSLCVPAYLHILLWFTCMSLRHAAICLCVFAQMEGHLDVCWQKTQSKSFKPKQLFVLSVDWDAHQTWNNKVCTVNLLP